MCGVFGEVTIEVESNGGFGEAPTRCVIAVVTTRQLVCGPDPMAPCRMVDGVAAAL